MHPSARLRGTKSRILQGKRIVLGVTGSIAAVETVRMAHELIRHGADVIPVMTRSAANFVGPMALEYATGHAPIQELSGAGEHVALLGGGRGSADALLIAPATANTISKIALGIDDTPVTTLASVALGSKIPVLVAPAMHEVMGSNPAVAQRLKELERLGVHVVPPRIEEEKAKVASAEVLLEAVVHVLARGPLVGKRVLIISGATAEPLDPIRVVTNRSTGRMGIELAAAAHRRGAEVDLWNAWGLVPLPEFAQIRRFETVGDLLRLVRGHDLESYAAILMPAALSDFAPKAASGKLGSQAAHRVELKPLPKVIEEVRRRAPKSVLVAFKAESDARRLLPRAKQRLKDYRAELVVANGASAFGASRSEAYLVARNGAPRRLRGSKTDLATQILARVERLLEA